MDSGLKVIARKALSIGHEVGRGRFKRVHRGVLHHRDVVVVHYTQQGKEPGEEVDILTKLAKCGHNAHVPEMYGCIRQKDGVFLISELASLGALSDVLKMSPERLLCAHRLHIAAQLAGAMTFLESEAVVHGDLSCRNVLLFNLELDPVRTLVKISDFGLAIIVASGQAGVCRKQPRAVRWAAPETVKDFWLSHSADCWSLGVTIWELFADATTPWCKIEKRADVADALGTLADGIGDIDICGHFPRSGGCPPVVHTLSMSCLCAKPTDRPRFDELHVSYVKSASDFQDYQDPSILVVSQDLSTGDEDASCAIGASALLDGTSTANQSQQSLHAPRWLSQSQELVDRIESHWLKAMEEQEKSQTQSHQLHSFEAAAAGRFERLHSEPNDLQLRLETLQAYQQQRQEAAVRRLELSVMDQVALEAKRDGVRLEQRLEQQEALEDRLQQLRNQQASSEEAGKQRMVQLAMMRIGAAKSPAHGHALAPPRAQLDFLELFG